MKNILPKVTARAAAICYVAWGTFHLYVAWDIASLGLPEAGLVQARLFQLAAYMVSISSFVIVVAIWLNWRNSRIGYWLNICMAGWADLIWVLVVVLPGYVGLARGLIPPAIFLSGAMLSSLAIRLRTRNA
jgi:hypothetical protein